MYLSYETAKYGREDSKPRLEAIVRCIEFLEESLKEKKVAYKMTEEIKEWMVVGYEI
jgi:hypothetical protein